jgi:hypothetical protein
LQDRIDFNIGTSTSARGVRFYYEWVRDHVGRFLGLTAGC